MRKIRITQSGALIYLMLLPWLALAENGKLVIHIADPMGRPVQGIWLSTAGDGGGEAGSDATGRVRLSLAAQTKANTWVTIQIVRSPKKKDFVLASPWNSKALVPSFENESDNYVDVVVIERGDKAALESGKVISSIAARVNDANSAQIFSSRHDATTPKQNLARIAQQYGLSPPDIDNAIRAWGKKATDPFDIGLAQFYAKNYSDASDNLALSVQAREGDLKTVTDKAFNANFFLGQALYAQGAYQRAAKTFKRASELRPDDARTINLEALSLEQAAQFSDAEPLFRHALLINERTKGATDRVTLISRSNLASILLDERDFASARLLFEQVLPVELNAMPNDPATASTMTGLASLLKYEHDYVGATKLDQRALAILKANYPGESPEIASALNNLGELLEEMNDYKNAEPLLRQALKIDEKVLGENNPGIVPDLSNLAALLRHEYDFCGAQQLLERAIAIDESSRGLDDPQTRELRQDLTILLKNEADANIPTKCP